MTRYLKSQLNINLLITSGLNKYIELKYIKKESNNVDNITYVDDVDIESLLYSSFKSIFSRYMPRGFNSHFCLFQKHP